MGAIRVSIGASVDPSVARGFAQVEQSAARAYGRMRDANGRFSKDQVAHAAAAAAKTTAAAERAETARLRAMARVDAQIARLESQAAARSERMAQQRSRAAMKEFDERLRASRRARDAEERDILRVAAAAERAESRKAAAEQRSTGRDRRAFGREWGNRSASNLGQAARFGMGVAGQIVRGAGVDLDIGNAVGRNVELEKGAIDLSNAGYNPAEGKGRVDPARIQAEVKAAADANAFSRTETLGGLQAFVGKTGELEMGLRLMKDLGALSKATGTDLGDMVDAAGDVSNALDNIKDPEEKFKRITATMKAMAGQGKIGAVEIKDLASQMAKLGANATAFEGDAAENVALMGAFAQMARSKGGASSATMAATSVASMTNTFKTPARIAAFKNEGIDVMNEQGMIRNPQQLLMAALSKTGGDPERFKKMFANVQGARAVEGFATIYRQSRGAALDRGMSSEDADAAGLKAVNEEFRKLKEIAIGEGEIRESLNRALTSQAAKAQQFNNRIDDVAADMQQKLGPALERAAPGLIKLADALATAIAWAAENPGKMIALAIVGSIVKAGIETAISTALTNVIMKAGGAASLPGGGGAAGTGRAGKGLALGAAAVVGFGTGAALDAADEEADKRAEKRQTATTNQAINAGHALRMAQTPEAKAAALAEAEKTAAALKQRIANADNATALGEIAPNFASAAANWVTVGSFGSSLGAQSQAESDFDNRAKNEQELAALKAEMAATRAAIESLGGKTLNVNVMNPTPAAGPGVDPSGRTPAPGP